MTNLMQKPEGEWLVTTDKSTITAEHIVIAMERMYFINGPISYAADAGPLVGKQPALDALALRLA